MSLNYTRLDLNNINKSNQAAEDLDNDLDRYDKLMEKLARKRSRKSEDDEAI